MKKEELYEDVLEEEPENMESKEYKKWEKRLYNSTYRIEPEEHHEVLLEKNKRNKDFGLKLASSPLNSKIHWDVRTKNGGITCKSLEHAFLMSLVLQMNERLKRIEKNINNNVKYGKTKLL